MKSGFLSLLIGVLAATPALAQSGNECLYASTPSASENCRPDPLQLASEPRLAAARGGFGLADVRIDFVGCERGSFATRALPSASARRAYQITYPADLQPLDRYIAPITHELGHVLQMEAAGGPARLSETITPLERELGADFLSGVALRNMIGDLRRSLFKENLNLTGSYCEAGADAHGSPEDRSNAFQSGFMFDYAAVGSDPRRAHAAFIDSLHR
jgi:hypothetical protein